MFRLCETLTPKSKARLNELKLALIVSRAVRGKRGDAANAAARRALRDAGVKRPRKLGRLVRLAGGGM